MNPPCSTSMPLTPSSATATPRRPSRLLLFAALLAGCPAPADNGKPADADTAEAPSPEGSTAGDCADGLDNDQDGLTDCADEGCASSADCADPTVDADGDGVPADQDCDDADPASTAIAQDADCDGALTADDCDDANAASTIRAEDGDCDAVLTADDCDDGDPASTVRAEDGDCDAVLTADDCDDGDPASTVRAEDGDCDAVLTAEDCDDGDPAIGLADVDDPDCDGVPTHFGGGDMIRIPAGTFDMGCTPGQSECYGHESPVTRVTLSRPYYLGQTEVTQGEFEAVMGYSPTYHPTCGANCPIEYLSWHEAAAFTNAVSAAAGIEECYPCVGTAPTVTCLAPADPYTCEGYRLPTEAEWEAAARCGEDLLYAGSGFIDDVAWWVGNSGDRPRPVAEKAPNSCDLYDMTGNVYEWTNDWHDLYGGGSTTDPTGPITGTTRVFRGGSFWGIERYARIANRDHRTPETTIRYVGFRLARTAQ